jgi:hypothetical protein
MWKLTDWGEFGGGSTGEAESLIPRTLTESDDDVSQPSPQPHAAAVHAGGQLPSLLRRSVGVSCDPASQSVSQSVSRTPQTQTTPKQPRDKGDLLYLFTLLHVKATGPGQTQGHHVRRSSVLPQEFRPFTNRNHCASSRIFLFLFLFFFPFLSFPFLSFLFSFLFSLFFYFLFQERSCGQP